MKSANMSTIVVLALGLMVWPVEVSEAVPMGTAFTYQGRLIDANEPADGLYDLEFRLFDRAVDGKQVGSRIDVNDLDVIDGYFTVELDFGSKVFDGAAKWLDIGARPGDSSYRYTVLRPRQEVTPTPYALYAETAGEDNDWMVSGSDMYSIPSGKVGIGTTSPTKKLEVAGDVTVKKIGEDVDISLVSGIESSSKLLFGNRFEPGAAAIKFDNLTGILSFKNWMTDDALVITQDGKVGIGTTNPGAKLEVNGDLKVKGAYLGSFPRPAYDSGWVGILPSNTITLYHNLGGNVDNYVVDMDLRDPEYYGINNYGIGGFYNGVSFVGARWTNLTTNSIKVYKFMGAGASENIRIRIWVYK